MEGGESDYRILLPEQPNAREKYAAEELAMYLEKSTGAALPVTSEATVSGKYLSVGKTSLAMASGLELTYDRLGDDGFFLSQQGDDLIMAGYGGDGTLFSVYEFLETTLGVRFYAEDEIVVPSMRMFRFTNTQRNSVPILKRGHWDILRRREIPSTLCI